MFSIRDLSRYDAKKCIIIYASTGARAAIHYYMNICILLQCMLLIKIEGLIFVSTEPFF